ncbi:MAG TPA: flagellar basal-body rod protein FlgG [Candidatus Desulfofervidus auxilii]|uniref:Flagellar basal-body rod protein FlgG n=1 Tax=Desulfofervidus auxilii TaxID=1621989 RepID=A0A7C0U2J2_DESA2|nr:flagellar basal-body rod protein FlgG [Candidatus Desulfofervidus auxilii]HDD43995.1 flagellar basal-body rod protein FlgG [Candidatus Desulfofervidus auxilii]
MIRALWIAASGMEAQNLNVDVIANNLANVNTVGFKKSRADFQDLMYQSLLAPGTASTTQTTVPTGIELGQGVRPVAVQKIFSQGDFQKTDNPLDMAIEGDGFFQILLPNGELAYTRSGAFKLDREGRIVTSDGYLLQPEIAIPEDTINITIGSDGTISVTQPGQSVASQVGQLQIVKFINPAGLKSIGRNLFIPTESSGEPIIGIPGEEGFGTIAQGYLELSNVSVVEEMVNMIIAQRAYEVNAKAIQTADEMLQMANNVKR